MQRNTMEEKNKKICKICGETFSSDKSLHIHIARKHKIILAEYYTAYYPKYDLYSKEPIPFIDKEQYDNTFFINRNNLIKWSEQAPNEKVKEYLINQLKYRIQSKNLMRAPCHLDIETKKMPPIDLYRKFFKGYTNACNELEIEPLFSKKIMKNFFNPNNSFEEIKILIDSREQLPLVFKNSAKMKLDFGDYTAAGKNYDYTYVDRKTEGDFKGTMTKGFERFKKEILRAKQFNSYIFVLVESTVDKINANNESSLSKTKMPFVWNRMRSLMHEFPGVCQFVFSGSRENSISLIPKILNYGKILWNVDMQYFIDKQL